MFHRVCTNASQEMSPFRELFKGTPNEVASAQGLTPARPTREVDWNIHSEAWKSLEASKKDF